MHKKLKVILFTMLFLIITISFMGCNVNVQYPFTSTPEFAEISKNNYKFTEDKPVFGKKQSPIGQICYQSETNKLFATYPEQGVIISWDVDSKQILSEASLGKKGPFEGNFSMNCMFIIGGIQHEFRDNRDFIEGIKIWETLSGKEQYCISAVCDGDSFHPYEIGTAIDSTGKLVAAYSYYSVAVFNKDEGRSAVLSVRDPDNNYPTIGLVSFGPDANNYTIGFLEGEVDIYDLGPTGMESILIRAFGQNQLDDRKPVFAIAMDPTGSLIGRIRGDNLTIWQRNFLSSEIVINAQLTGQTQLQFDETGKYIFVAGGDKLVIYSLDEKKKITEFNTVGITSMVVSNDSNFIFWGDTLGAVHILRNNKSGK